MKNQITLIGDVHGKYKRYHEIIREKDRHPFTVQLGDFGFNYETLANVDPKHHVIVGGNHDNYDVITSVPNYLGDFGYVNNFNGVDFFFYRGAWSIDRSYRTIGIDWWPDEENNIEAFMQAKELYCSIKPDIVLTHDCPHFVVSEYLPPHAHVCDTRTTWALEELYSKHQPKIWCHGHYHVSKTTKFDNTTFVCLAELEPFQLNTAVWL